MMDRVSIIDALDESQATGCLEVIATALLSIDESLRLMAYGQAMQIGVGDEERMQFYRTVARRATKE